MGLIRLEIVELLEAVILERLEISMTVDVTKIRDIRSER